MALPTLFAAALVRAGWAPKPTETASPAASSDGVLVFEPEERRYSDLARLADEEANTEAPLSAAMFVLTTILRLPLWVAACGAFLT